jgi:hypothetical protein
MVLGAVRRHTHQMVIKVVFCYTCLRIVQTFTFNSELFVFDCI